VAFNPQPTDKDIAVDVFGGLVTDMNPSDLPEGVSPDCSDMEFLPGSVFSRRGLKKVFNTPMGAVTVTYGKSYVDPVGVIRNLYLDSAGNLWVENLTSSPGTYTLLATTTPGSYAKSITAFGREYIAISDGLHGTDVPLQYDGTNLDRVTQDGPGAPPTVSCFSYPGVVLAAASVVNINPATIEIDPTGVTGGYFTGVNIFVSSGASALADNIGISITVSGTNATFNLTYTVTAVFGDTLIQAAAYSATGAFYGPAAGGQITYGGPSLSRSGNVVTGTTASAHNLQAGYQVQVSGVPAATIGTSVSTIVINNEDNPGLATVTMGSAHGLIPGLFISLTGVIGVAVGGGATAAVRVGQIVTVTTATSHGLSPNAQITTSSFATGSFNTTAFVQSVISPTQFTFVQVDVDATDTTGVISVNWYIPNNSPSPDYFQVLTAPSPTVFQIAINYSNSPAGGWATGTVKYAWSGSFFVSSVPTATSFTYQQYGPNASTSTTVGTLATPYGQAAPGQHQLQVAFLTRQDAITAPSPPVKFTANGGQYISVKDIPIGPSNIKGRILCFTGAQGAYFYYIPTPPQVNGILVGTATQINDNTTANIVLDFSDNALFSAIGISLQGNNLANQIVLDGALGFGLYSSRLLAYGQRNAIQGGTGAGGLLNMGFDGGYFKSNPTLPTGWDATLNVGGALATGHYGSGWLITTVAGGGNKGILSQSMYQNYSGAPVAAASTQYKIRAWLKPSVATANLTFTVAITSATGATFSSVATISGALMSTSGSWLEAPFSLKTPSIIPADLLLSVYASSVTTSPTLLVDEMFIIYSDNPYTDEIINGSYVNNPEGFDGVSGVFGPEDTHKVMGLSEIRKTLYVLTRDPGGHLHETADNGTTEPAGWDVDPTASECGLISTFALTVSQADENTESGGETWMAWASSSGARIFSGGDVPKISQEIQPDWDSVNTATLASAWALNDPNGRVIYFGLPISSAENRVPNRIYTMNYRQMSTASEIAGADPVHVSLTGKLSAKDNARKWCPWVLTMNGAALMYRAAGKLQPVFFGGDGVAPNTGSLLLYGNVYTLDPAKLTDDDYGQIHPYYFLYFLPGTEQGQQMGIGSRSMLAYLTAQIYGVGLMTITPFCDNLSNPWALSCSRTMTVNPKFDLEWVGANAVANRMSFKCSSSPVTGTDNSFVLQLIRAWLRTNARLPIRGAAR
jgi:hypothetical protein